MNANKKAIDVMIEALLEVVWKEGDRHDFHSHAFNLSLSYFSNHEIYDDLCEYGIFEAIKYVMRYEKDRYGEISTDFSNPQDLYYKLLYILGEEFLHQEIYESYRRWTYGIISTDEFVQEIEKYVY